MPAETLHTTHQGPQPGEKVTESGIILPAGVDRQKNVRETIQFDTLEGRSTKYNSPGVDPNNPYNAFAPEAAQPAEAAKALAENQPRRVRNVGNGNEKLVQYEDGQVEWVPVDGAEREPQENLHTEAIIEVATGIDTLEASDKEQNQEIAELKEQVKALMEQVAALTELLRQSREQDTEESEKAADDAAPEEEWQPKYPGQEVVLFDPEGREAVLVDDADEAELEPDVPEDGERYAMPPELEEAWQQAKDKYARETAKSRSSLMGHFLQNSTRLIAIPGFAKIADWANSKFDKNVDTARLEYTTALNALQENYEQQILEEYEDTPELREHIRISKGTMLIESAEELERRIADERIHQSGKVGKLADWWARQDGAAGKWKRAGIVAGVAVAGIGLGVAGALVSVPVGLVGGAAGIGVGVATGLRINKKRAGVGDALVTVPAETQPGTEVATGNEEPSAEATEPLTADGRIAAQHSAEDIAQKREYVEDQLRQGNEVDVDELERFTTIRTADEMTGNRWRTAGITAAGAAGAAAGIVGGSILRDTINNAPPTEPVAPEPEVEAEVPPVVVPETPPIPEIVGNDFTVEPGNGFIRELQDFAAANGKQLTLEQAGAIHEELAAETGGDYIDIGQPGNDIYVENGDFRLMEPGSAQWADGISERIQQKMADRGLW